MFGEVPAKRLRLIERIVDAGHRLIRRTRLPGSIATAFLRAYYRGVAAEDLGARGPGYHALRHLLLVDLRKPSTPE